MNQQLMEDIFQALTQVVDPSTGLDVVRMRVIEDLRIENEGRVKLVLHPSSPVCPLAYKVAADIKLAIKRVPGIKDVEVKIKDFKDANRLEAMLKEI
ncbi:MAG: metal-sulfur cluster assembly factor [Thermodesulfobacteriota bacterium]|nr:MAG: metal-sulfur cluster assembly factor [Thermodesulfobacteriota bacterium]